jgi:hypothetical protein
MIDIKEVSTQEVMQYAIVLIDKLGFQSTKIYDSTKNKIVACIDNFEAFQSRIKAEHRVDIEMFDFYSNDVQDRAEEVLQYFCNVEPKKMGSQEETFKTIKEVSMNYYSTTKEFGTICYMYYMFKSRETTLTLLKQEAKS